MLPKTELKKIVSSLAEIINRSTGIHINESDISAKSTPKELKISAWNCTLARLRWPQNFTDSYTNYVITKLTADVKKLRSKIINCKISHLTHSLPHWENDIKKSLIQQNVSTTFINSLIFKIVDHGYSYGKFKNVKEAHYDYPFIILKIHNRVDFDFLFPINVYDVIDPVDIEYLKHSLFIAILEKNLHNSKQLGEL